jgi:pyruvate dehydrogenase E1 component alpha subunit
LRPEAERQLWERRDPIERLSRALLDARLATQAELDAAYDGVVAEIARAVRFAQESPYPEPEEAVQHVTTLH